MKNIEWLKDSITKVMQDLFSTSNPNYFDFEKANKRMRELVDQLDEPEVLSVKWIDEHAFGDWNEYVYADDLKELLVPKQEITEEQALRKLVEKYPLTPNDIPWILDRYVANVLVERPKKPVIPSYVADLMEDYNDASIQSFLSDAFRNYREGRADRADTWIIKNSANFVDAYRYGYTVGEEHKYYARIKGWENVTTGSEAFNWVYFKENDVVGISKAVENKYQAISFTKHDWNNLGIDEDNADFVKVNED